MTFARGVQVQGLQARQLRQAKHDERCRPYLEELAAAAPAKRSYSRAVRILERAHIPAPRGGKWSVGQVYKVARRLGLDLTCGRAWGELPGCVRCNSPRGFTAWTGLCRRCRSARERREWAKDREQLRQSEIREAEERIAYYTAKLEALRSGGRHSPRQHPKRAKFGKREASRFPKESTKRKARE